MEEFRNKLINNYKKWSQIEQTEIYNKSRRTLARTEKRKIEKIYEKTFHKTIDTDLNMCYNNYSK